MVGEQVIDSRDESRAFRTSYPCPSLDPSTAALEVCTWRSEGREHRIPAVTGMWRSFLEVEERTVQVTEPWTASTSAPRKPAKHLKSVERSEASSL